MKLKIEYQYFEGCPNHSKMQKNLYDAIIGIEDKIELQKTIVDDEFVAMKVKFRGSPSLLIEGKDIAGMPEPLNPSLSCRFYQNGLPTSDEIRNSILEKLYK